MGGYRTTDPETCRLAYEGMVADGTLSKRRLEAIACLAGDINPLTAGEIARKIGSSTNRNNVATRLSELEHLGLVKKCSERTCEVSDKICWTWELTGAIHATGEIPKNINTTEIIRKQRDRAIAKLKEMERLVMNVAHWLKDQSHRKSDEQCKKASRKLTERYIDIMAGKPIKQKEAPNCSVFSEHEWKEQPNGYFRCTKCPFEKTAAEIAIMEGV